MADVSPFLDRNIISGSLYQDQQRLADRTGALISAKITGRPAPQVIADHAVREADLTRRLQGRPTNNLCQCGG
ncbi:MULTISPECIES: hypothetical protein [Kitasatospora]|uniref:hypothetical protein n=1 Tax=Kitasatospora TaxID=2063 RepID=UPI0036BD55D9